MAKPILIGSNLALDGEAERDADGRYLRFSQQGWEQHFAGTGKRIPAVWEYVAAFKQLDERKDYALSGILQDLNENLSCAGKIDYRSSNIPVGNGYIDQLVADTSWRRALEDELFHYDAGETAKLLQKVSGKHPYIWTLNVSGRKSNPEKAVWLFISKSRFGLSCDNSHISIDGRARGVSVVSTAKEVSNIAIPEMKISPVPIAVSQSYSEQAGQTGHNAIDLAYARGLLDGLPSGTVMDWKKRHVFK
ncbi:MAG: hypothetical protein AABY40_01030 [Nanoarchaeota archaeon]